MNLVSMKKVVRRSWDKRSMPDTMIARVNKLSHRQPNYLDFLDYNKLPIQELESTEVDAGKNGAPHIELI